MLATLPERTSLARQDKMPYQDFLQLIVSDEISRRERSQPTLGPASPGWTRAYAWRCVSLTGSTDT